MKYLCLSAFLLATGLLSCQKEDKPIVHTPPVLTTAGKTYSLEEVTAFKQLTVFGEFDDGYIHKLPKKVGIYLTDTSYPLINRELDTVLAEINRITDTNLVIRRVPAENDALIRVYPTSRDHFLQVEPGAAPTFTNSSYELDGLMVPYWDNASVLTRESVFVDMERTGTDSLLQRYLMHHEMMHALGCLGHIHIDSYAYNSVMYYYNLQPYLVRYTSSDLRMIGLLYNPAIISGMDNSAFNAVIVNL